MLDIEVGGLDIEAGDMVLKYEMTFELGLKEDVRRDRSVCRR